MDKRSLILGIGIGALTVSIAILLSYITLLLELDKTNYEEISNTEIIARAKELGMVMAPQTNLIKNDNGAVTISKEQTVEEDKLENDELDELTVESFIVYEITNEMSSTNICKDLQQKGVIDDATKFHEFLVNKDATKRLRNGSYQLEKDMSYEELYKQLTNTKY